MQKPPTRESPVFKENIIHDEKYFEKNIETAFVYDFNRYPLRPLLMFNFVFLQFFIL